MESHAAPRPSQAMVKPKGRVILPRAKFPNAESAPSLAPGLGSAGNGHQPGLRGPPRPSRLPASLLTHKLATLGSPSLFGKSCCSSKHIAFARPFQEGPKLYISIKKKKKGTYL